MESKHRLNRRQATYGRRVVNARKLLKRKWLQSEILKQSRNRTTWTLFMSFKNKLINFELSYDELFTREAVFTQKNIASDSWCCVMLILDRFTFTANVNSKLLFSFLFLPNSWNRFNKKIERYLLSTTNANNYTLLRKGLNGRRKSWILTICRSRKHESKSFYWFELFGDGILKRQTFVLQNNTSQRKLTALNNNSKNAQKKRALTRVFQNALMQKTCVRFACALARYLWAVLYLSWNDFIIWRKRNKGFDLERLKLYHIRSRDRIKEKQF